MAVVTSVEYVEVSVTAATEPVTVNLTLSQDETQCVPFYSVRCTGATGPEGREQQGKVEFIDNAGTPAVRVTATAMTETSAVVYQIFVVEFDPSITVQQVSGGIADTATSGAISIADVGSQATAFFTYSYQIGGASDFYSDYSVRATFTGAATDSVTVSRVGTAGAVDGVLYVVECNAGEFTVEHAEILFSASAVETGTDTIAATVLADTFLVHTYSTDEASNDIRDGVWQASLTNTTTVTVDRNIGNTSGTNTSSHTIQVVECQNNEWDVQRNAALVIAAAPQTDAINAIDQDFSIINRLGPPQSVGRDSTASTIQDDISCASSFSADDEVTFDLQVATVATSVISYEVIQFATGVAPAFTVVPAVQDVTTTQIDLVATADANSTLYSVATIRGSTTPDAAEIMAGLNGTGGAALADNSAALTAAVQGSMSLTGLSSSTHPLVDIHSVVDNAGGTSAVSTLTGVFLNPPAGTVFVTVAIRDITAASQAANCQVTSAAHGLETGQLTHIYGVAGMVELNETGNESPTPDDGILYWEFTSTGDDTGTLGVNSTGFTGYTSGGALPAGFSLYTGAIPAVVDNDVIKVDQVTVINDWPITANPDGTVYIDTGDPDNTAFDWWQEQQYDVSAGAYEAVSTFSRYESAPILVNAFDDPVEIWQNVEFSLEVTGQHVEHPNGLTLTGSLADGPDDIAFDNGNQTIEGTTADTAGTYAVTLTMTSPTGLSSDFEFDILVVETAQMPDVTNDPTFDVTEAAAVAAITGAGLALPNVVYSRNLAVTFGNVISQDPVAGEYFPVDGSGYNSTIVVSADLKGGARLGLGRLMRGLS